MNNERLLDLLRSRTGEAMIQASDVTRNLPSADEVLRSIGLQRARGSSGEMLGGVAVFGAGLLVGAGLALLFAPSSGAETREQIGAKVEDAKEKLGQMASSQGGASSGASARANGG
ncbi:MAG: YtxH domain-containing protein [Candidatus Binatia bacterium]